MLKSIPYPFYKNDVPIDISFIFEHEKPAGKHGFLKTDGSHFSFEDGTRVAFWGTNINGGANFPEHDYAEKLARRFAKIGINMVRFHQLDAEWNTPNIFSFTKGKRVENTLSFDPESMDRLDYLLYCLKKEGIYCYMDMYTYRKFKSGDGVENAENLKDRARPYNNFSRKLIELQKDHCEKFWTHVNPYTGLSYADEPAIVMAEIVNESDLFNPNNEQYIEPYKTEFLELFDKWLKENNIDKKASDFDLSDLEDETLINFKIYITESYYKELYDCMRKCGVKIPISGTNWNMGPAIIKAQMVTDYMDAHAYQYDWRWTEFEHCCMNTGIAELKQSYLAPVALGRPAGMPVFVSEWDVTWPNAHRAESVLYSAALGMHQGWSGFAIHTYAYTNELERMNVLGKEITAPKVGNIPYREGVFATWNDPAKFGLFYHAALITRRGDVSESPNEISLKPLSMTKWDNDALDSNLEKSKIVTRFEDDASAVYGKAEEDNGEILSDTGELYRSWKKRIGYINTPMTKCAYGYVGRNEVFDLSGVKIKGITDFAVIAISSLTDKPICESDNMLLTTVGRAENTGAKFSGELMTDLGTAPVLAEVIEAEFEIETSVTGLSVWAISAEGLYIGTVPARYEDGKFKFKTGDVSQSIYYLIVKE